MPEAVDLAVICLPGAARARRGGGGARSGVQALCVISSGFAEVGAEGRERQERLLALVRAHGARLVGPNCLGIAVPPLGLNATFGPRPLPPGPIGFSSQSGALGLALLEKAAERQPRLLRLRLDRQQGRRLVERPARVVGGRRRDGARPALPRVVRQPAQVRAPRAARRAPEADPRAQGGLDRAPAHARRARTPPRSPAPTPPSTRSSARPACSARGRSRSSSTPRRCSRASRCPRGRRVGVVTNAGGLGILCADACEAAGLELPELERRDARRARSRSCRRRRASRTRSTCSARRPPRRTRRCSRRCSPTRARRADRPLRPAGRRGRRRGRGGDPRRGRARLRHGQAGARGRGQRRRERRRRCARTARRSPAFAYPGVGGARARARRRRARNGCGAPPARSRARRGSTSRPRARIVEAALDGPAEAWLDADADSRRCSRPTASRSSPSARRRPSTRPSRRPTSSASRSSSRPRRPARTRRSSGGVALDLRDERPGSRGRRADRRAGARPADRPRRRRAARGHRPGSGLRPARRLRARRRLRRADRRRRASGSRRSRTSTRTSSSTAARPAASSRGFRGAPPRMRPRSSTWCTGSRGSPRTCPRSPSSTSTPCIALPERLRRSRRARPSVAARALHSALKSW